MYHRDQHEKHSLSSYFDDGDKSRAAATAPSVTTPLSPLTTTVAMANPLSRSDQETHVSGTSGGELRVVNGICTCTGGKVRMSKWWKKKGAGT